MFFSGIYFAAGGRFTLVICLAGNDPENQPNGTQMNITSITHERQALRHTMGDSMAHAQSDVGFAAISGSCARSRVALIRPSSRPVGRRTAASPVLLTG
jgi:hypothetical protein